MPAPVSLSSSARTASKGAPLKSRIPAQVKKTRIVRPRGRAKDAGSDDEIEREVGTDSDSEDELSSLDSDSDSDTEPASEDIIPNGHSRTFTPGTSQSPDDRGVHGKDAAAHITTDSTSFFNSNGTWSEMVADENANGPADLPVIEFTDFDGKDIPQAAPRSRKTKKPARNTRAVAEAPETPQLPLQEDSGEEEPIASTSRRSPNTAFVKRPPGQTARQAYQQRLESDPSYVPTVGGFWGHDDRLLDKDLRSLSGWWRGRWQGRGRGRGFTRGRGGFVVQSSSHADTAGEEPAALELTDVPPIDRAWTHDGFEEMKRREEQRRAAQQIQPPEAQSIESLRGGGAPRGGRGFTTGRGGRGGFAHGGHIPSSTRSHVNSPFGNTGRIWYGMKPELMWTKQHEGFLHYDSSMRPRPGQGPGFRVKLPGNQLLVVRAPPRSYSKNLSTRKTPAANAPDSDAEEKLYAVRLPKSASTSNDTQSQELASGETPNEDVFTVRPRLVESNPIPLPEPVHTTTDGDDTPIPEAPLDPSTSSHGDVPVAASSQPQPEASIRSQLEHLSLDVQAPDAARWAQTEEAVLRNPSNTTLPDGSIQRPALSNVQTVFSPPISQASPAYNSPYGYAPSLPPGIAMNQLGMPYEIATGRPVYLQPPPAPMYNPRPLMHSHVPPSGLPFVPGHMHHHSAVSPDFLAHSASHTPPLNGFIDPSTGIPIFSFPRQTTRIEIRSPEESEAKSPPKSAVRRASGLRTTATAFQPSSRLPENHANGYFPLLNGTADAGSLPSYASVDGAEVVGPGDEGQTHQHMTDPAMLAYPHYQQPYYYPEAYGYPPYMDVAQGYDAFSSEHHPPQGTVYY